MHLLDTKDKRRDEMGLMLAIGFIGLFIVFLLVAAIVVWGKKTNSRAEYAVKWGKR